MKDIRLELVIDEENKKAFVKETSTNKEVDIEYIMYNTEQHDEDDLWGQLTKVLIPEIKFGEEKYTFEKLEEFYKKASGMYAKDYWDFIISVKEDVRDAKDEKDEEALNAMLERDIKAFTEAINDNYDIKNAVCEKLGLY